MEVGRRRSDVSYVLPEGVPLTPVALVGQPQQAPRRRPHAVGGHHRCGTYLAHPVDGEGRTLGIHLDPNHCVTDPNVGASPVGQVKEGRVVLATGNDYGVLPVAPRQGEPDGPSRGAVEDRSVYHLPSGDGSRIQAEFLTQAEGQGGQPVATALIPRKRSLVDHQDRGSGPGRGHGGCRAGGTSSHDCQIDLHTILRRVSARRTRCLSSRRSPRPRSRCPGPRRGPGPAVGSPGPRTPLGRGVVGDPGSGTRGNG